MANEPKPEISQNPTINSNSPVPTASNRMPLHKSHKVLYVVIAFLVALLIGAGVWLYLLSNNNDNSAQPAKPKSQTASKPTQSKVDADLAKFINPTTGETWLASPVKLAKLGYFKDSESENAAEYFKVGSHGANTLIMGEFTMVGTEAVVFEKSPAGQVTAIIHPDGQAVYDQDEDKFRKEEFATSIKIDSTTHFDSLSLPPKFDLDKGYVVTKPNYATLGDIIDFGGSPNAPKTSLVRKIGASSLYRDETVYTDTKLTSIGYHLQTPLGTSINLGYTPLELEANQYQWSSNSIDDKFHAITRGCGGRASSVSRVDNLSDADFRTVAKSPSGQQVYELTDSGSPLIQKAYSEYKDFSSGDTSDVNAGISKADFIKAHAIVGYKDHFGQWLIYVRDQLAPAGGCAKPVIYLYPTHSQNVSVRVGANVKLSEPFYDPLTGWQNVLANPNGTLSVGGVKYDSLFWEGPGTGSYPSINSGVVVATDQAVTKIRQQLAEQGLNSKEVNDFVDYWKDKLPKTKYVRLTWLNTADMNRLAPLTINPKPDTTIRVFLDFAGLDTPIDLLAQKLNKVDRKGFTVVEWGGLSPYKLY